MTLSRRTLLGFAGAAAIAGGAGAFLLRQRAPANAPGFVDAAGRSVGLPARVARVLTAGPPASVLLYALAPEKMLGWARALSTEEKAYLAPPYRDLPEHGRLTGRGNTANLEHVAALAPDLIIDSGQIDRTYASLADRVQQQTGVPYILLDGAFAKSAETIRLLGGVVGAETRAELLARYAAEVIGSLAALPASSERPRVYYGRGPEGLETGRAGSITTELLETVAQNVADAAGEGGLTNVSPEQILAWEPDVIIAQDPRFRDALLNDGRWAGLKAVRERRVFLQPTLPFGWIDSPPGINRLIGVRWLRAVLYDDAANLRDEARDFYELFYRVRLTDAQLDALVSGLAP
ncbi:MAG: iron ABC transporter substrate-binding protein [Caulobacterales bacterium]|nr:iron ABC transporter substrate-binding protein [Caulobacterales bacterium]